MPRQQRGLRAQATGQRSGPLRERCPVLAERDALEDLASFHPPALTDCFVLRTLLRGLDPGRIRTCHRVEIR
jgi:hypothetical protein